MSGASYSMYPSAHYQLCGTGQYVLLLHGWGASSALFQPLIEDFKQHYTLIAPDFPGFGLTSAPTEVWSVNDYALWVLELLNSLQIEQVHIVGHSFGGRVAIKIASQWPERVNKLVLTGSAGIRPKKTLEMRRKIFTYKLLRRLVRIPFLPMWIRLRIEGRIEQSGSADYQQTSGTMRATFVRVVNEDLRSALPTIQSPTLLIWGENDQETPPSDGKLMEKLIPDAGFVLLKNAGHFAYIEQSRQFCHIVKTFLRGTSV